MKGKSVSNAVCCLGLLFVFGIGVIPAPAAPLTIDAGNEDYSVTTNETVDEIRVGNINDSNRLIVQNAATLTTTANHRLYLGYGATSASNLVQVTGAGSTINSTGDWTFVGLRGVENTLGIENGGTVNSYGGHVGYYPESVGNDAQIEDSGSRWNLLSEHLYVGRDGDSNSVTISAGGTVAIEGDGKDLRIGVEAAADNNRVTVTGSGSRLSANDAIYVGQSGTNSLLTVADGGSVSNGGGGFLGYIAGSSGTATVTGPQSQWTNTGSLQVGGDSRGILNVEAGGEVINGAGTIGHDKSSTGEVTVTGANSKWTNTGSLTVGLEGDGILNVEAGGEVVSAGGSITVDGKAFGEVTVTDAGSKWSNSGNLHVGHGSDEIGILVVAAGGVVSNTDGIIGYQRDGDGLVTVTGTGSKWNNRGDLYLGKDGGGLLNIESAGTVISTDGYIAYESLAQRHVATISGSGSTWTNSGDLHVGKSRSGTLNITDNGEVHVGGMTWLYANATVNIDGGAMSVGETLQLDAGSVVNLNSGTLSLISFSGDGNLNIENEGLVTVGGTTSIGATGTVNLTGGRFEFGQTTLAEFSTINATAGAMAGDVMITGVNDVALLPTLQNPAVDLSEVVVVNEGLLHGSAILKSSLDNQASGELRTLASDWVRFEGLNSANAGTIKNFGGQVDFARNFTNQTGGDINNFGGQIDFAQNVTNENGGFIGGRDVFIRFGGGLTNNGELGLSAGVHDILGSIDNSANGRVMVAGQSTATFYGDMTNGGDIFTGPGSHSVFLGDVTGGGNFPGEGIVEFAGEISPGNSPGTVTFGGDVVLGSGSTTVIELGGTVRGDEYDALFVDGDLTPGGSLDVLTIGGFVPQAGDFFDILDFEPADLNGMFDNMNLPSLTPGLTWDQTNLYTTGTLLVLLAPSPLSGDFNHDGTVDAADFTVWQDNLGLDAAVLNGNGSGAATVVQADYLLWKTNFGDSLASGSQGEPVPEPATLLLALLALVALPRRILAASQAWACWRKCPTSR